MAAEEQELDVWTLAGLTLLITPLLTMGHELLGHALTCLAVGQVPTELGAYYVECPGATGNAMRAVSMAGTGMDVLICCVAYFAWRRVARPLPQLILWLVFTVKGMVAAGYWCFSGLTNVGDWGIGPGTGLGALPYPWLLRAALFAVGVLAYIYVVRTASGMLDAMLGGGATAGKLRRKLSLTVYWVGGVGAFLVSLLNPQGFMITLLSAMASSFGGTAGLFNVAYRPPSDAAARPFAIGRHYAILAAGCLVTLAFAAVLGPTLRIR